MWIGAKSLSGSVEFIFPLKRWRPRSVRNIEHRTVGPVYEQGSQPWAGLTFPLKGKKMTIFLTIYLIFCIVNLIYSIIGMFGASKIRPLGTFDICLAVFLLLSGPIGTLLVGVIIIDFHVKLSKQKKVDEKLKEAWTDEFF